MTARALACFVLAMLMAPLGCNKNRPPAAPSVTGPLGGGIGETLSYSATAIDPQSKDVSYEFAWGDTSPVAWTPTYPSGQAVTRTHVYGDTGRYYVRVKAKNSLGIESEWSDTLIVAVNIGAPGVPQLDGPRAGNAGDVLTYSAAATDPAGDSVAYYCTWGDASTPAWSRFHPSGQTVPFTHTYADAGKFYVKVRAKNGRGVESLWSDSIDVTVTAQALPVPVVDAWGVNSGSTLRLSWSQVPGATGYRITVGGSSYTTQMLTWDVTTVAAQVLVQAFNGSATSPACTVDCSPTVTYGLTLYGISDPNSDHPAGIGFSSDGSAVAYTLESGNYPFIDFYLEDVQLPMSLVNSGDKGWNSKGNAAQYAGMTDFDAVQIAGSPGSGYSTQEALTSGYVYSLWLDPTDNGWDTGDRFGKMRVLSISGARVVLQIACQRIGGLRWLKTD